MSEWLESPVLLATYDNGNSIRAVRGGGWADAEYLLRSSNRDLANFPTAFGSTLGFRVASVLFPADPDTDSDGIRDRFETGTGIYVSSEDTGTNPNNPDTDGDGFDDGFEVSTGFIPTSATSTPEAQSSIRTAAEYRFAAANGISYRVEYSTDLATWATIETNIIGTGGVITRFYSIEGQPKRFFRSRRN